MNKGTQGVIIALAAILVVMMSFTTVLLGMNALAPKQADASPTTQPVIAPVQTGDDKDTPPINSIQVSAEGTVRVEPDIAYITLGVQSDAKTAEKAQQANQEKMTALYAVLTQLGIAEKDYYTSQYNVNPVYDYSTSTPRITGYTTVNMIEVTMRDLDKIGALLDAAAGAGMNQAYSLQFDLENPDAAGLDAMKTALANADAKAKVMAEATGVKIVRVLGISDNTVSTAVPYSDYRYSASESALKDAAGVSVPISSGTMEVTVQVHINYEIK